MFCRKLRRQRDFYKTSYKASKDAFDMLLCMIRDKLKKDTDPVSPAQFHAERNKEIRELLEEVVTWVPRFDPYDRSTWPISPIPKMLDDLEKPKWPPGEKE